MALTISPPQTGHRPEASPVGFGTVNMGRYVVDEIGAGAFFSSVAAFSADFFSESATAFLRVPLIRPEIIGGGSSRPSAAFRDSCLAKSDACHHSRNFSANIDVGSKNRREDRSLGPTTCVIVLALNMLFDWPGRAAATGFGAVAAAIAL